MWNATALSPEGTLLARSTPDGKRLIVYAVVPTTSAETTTTTGITTAALGPQCTLRLPPHHHQHHPSVVAPATTTTGNVVLRWLNKTHLAAVRFMNTTASSSSSWMTVWDVSRGVEAYTVDSSSSLLSSSSLRTAAQVETHSMPVVVLDMTTDHHATTTTDGLFYAACQSESSEKMIVQECSIQTGRLQRKIKVGKWNTHHHTNAVDTIPTPSACRMAVSRNCLVLAGRTVGSSSDAVIRVTDIRTGSKLSKIKLHYHNHNHNNNNKPPCLAVAGNIGCTIDMDDGDHHHHHKTTTTATLRIFHLQTGATLTSHSSPVAVPLDATLQLRIDETNESAYWLLLSTTSSYAGLSSSNSSNRNRNRNQLMRFCVDDIMTPTTYTMETTCTIETTPEDNTVLFLSPQALVAVKGDDDDDKATAAGTVQIQTFPLLLPETTTTTTSSLVISWETSQEKLNADTTTAKTTTTATAATKNKRKERTVLGPGQAGGEAHHVTEGGGDGSSSKKKQRRGGGDGGGVNDENQDDDDDDDDDNNPTIAERLAQLQQAMDADDDDDDDSDDDNADTNNNNKDGSRFVAKYATTESLTLLLQQALQSMDSGLLEQALSVRDVHIIRTTCRSLSSASVAALLQAITTRLASKPGRAEHLCVWITAVLQSNQIDNLEHLQPLQNLLQERLEVFPLLLQLEGRLERMASST